MSSPGVVMEAASAGTPITVMRSSDAKKENLSLSLDMKLSDLRDMLAEDDHFGVPADQQRIFYMGRELKTGNKSLSSLGVGKFPRIVLHLHKRPRAPAAAKKKAKNDAARKRKRAEAAELLAAGSMRRRQASNNPNPNPSDVIDLLDSDDDDDDEVEEVNPPPQQAPRAPPAENEIVDLLDSSDEEFGGDAGKDEEAEENADEREIIEID